MGQFARDNFTDTAGTTIQSHTPSGGGSWTRHTSYSNDSVITDANQCRHGGSAGTSSAYYHSASPASADYSVSMDVTQHGSTGTRASGPCGRMDTSANTFYHLRYEDTGSWKLFKFNAGTATQIGNYTQTLTVDVAYTALLDMSGTSVTGKVNGSTVIGPVTDSSISAAGKAGFRHFEASTNTNGLYLDNFSADEADPAATAHLLGLLGCGA